MAVFQQALPHYPWMVPHLARLPGTQPLQPGDYLRLDEAFAGQMALRDELIANRLGAVHGLLPMAQAAAQELYAAVLARLSDVPGYRRGQGVMLRPDGVEVPLNPGQPLQTLGRLVQEDLCILQPQAGAHILSGAILCFPASWTLAQKLGREMLAIHRPVAPYTPEMAARVQRMLDAIRPEAGLWRMNYLTYAVPDLHHPLPEEAPRDRSRRVEKPYVRCERQCLIRLPQTGAVVFTIHTYVMPRSYLPPEAAAALIDH
jgi:dimethylamine monooxygenase subunit A